MPKIVFISLSALFAFLNTLVFTDAWDYNSYVTIGLGIIYILLAIYIIARARADYRDNPLLWAYLVMTGFLIFIYTPIYVNADKHVFAILFGIAAYHLIKDRIDTHYQFKIFAVLMGLLSLTVPLSYIFSWDMTEHPLFDVFSPSFVITGTAALAAILLLRTHMWLKLPVALSIIAALTLSPQPLGIAGILAAMIIYTIFSHNTWRERLSNFLKISGFTVMTMIITAVLFYPHIVLLLGNLSGLPHLSLLFSGSGVIIQNTLFYIFLTLILFFSGKYIYDIFSSKAFKDNSIDDIEHNNIIMTTAILIIIFSCIPLTPVMIFHPVLWLSVGLLCRYKKH